MAQVPLSLVQRPEWEYLCHGRWQALEGGKARTENFDQ